jgi:hypothetical protein
MNDDGSILFGSPLSKRRTLSYAVHGAVGLLAGQAGLAAAAWQAFMHRCG